MQPGAGVRLLIKTGRKSFERLVDPGDLLEVRLARRVGLMTTGAKPLSRRNILAEAKIVPVDD